MLRNRVTTTRWPVASTSEDFVKLDEYGQLTFTSLEGFASVSLLPCGQLVRVVYLRLLFDSKKLKNGKRVFECKVSFWLS